MQLVAGLGNPGEKYERTPHNLGFMAIDRLAEAANVRVHRPEGNSLVGQGAIAGEEVLLVKPLSFMNLSGGPVKALLRKYGLGPEQLLVVYDELDLPWGAMRLKTRGSSGGHNGVKSIIASLGTQDFARLRLGIHPGHPVGDGAKFVLRQLRKDELEELDGLLERATEVIRLLISEGADKAMAVANRRA